MRAALFCAASTAAIAVAGGADATQFVTNGDFETSTSGPGQLRSTPNATGWSISGGYTFLFAPGTADTTGSNGEYGNLALWGPGSGVNNGLPAASPAGGNFIGANSDFQQAPITQTINGLTPNAHYTVSFYWAAAQQTGFYGPTADQWVVSLGGQSQSTTTFNLPNQGFSGWMQQSFTYTAASSSEVLIVLRTGLAPRAAAVRAARWRFDDGRRAGTINLGDAAPRFLRPRVRGLSPPPHGCRGSLSARFINSRAGAGIVPPRLSC